jgi:hypothetical protein
MPSDDFTMQRRADAIAATYGGRLEEAVDLYRGTVEADGWMSGILDTMAHGLLGLPLSFQGDPAMCSALLNVDDTPGDYERMHPENECAKIFRDGLGLGFGWGQYVLACWQCDGVDFDLVATMGGAGQTEQCRCCRALRVDRPVGVRQLFQLRWRDARWFYRNPVSRQWYYNGRTAMVPVYPGDGEWFLFETVPDVDVWRHGPWVWATIAAIFSRDSTFDAQNTSATCAPTHVFQANGGTAPATRQEVSTQADNLRFGNKLVMPGEWKHEIHAASSSYIEVTGEIVERCAGMFEVGITGNLHGMKAGTGFANMDVYARATRERRAFYASAWIRQIRSQGLVWWGYDNWGTRNVPIGAYDVRSPEDKLAQSNADKAEGEALKSMGDAYGSLGYELVPEYIIERAQAKGIRIQKKPGSASSSKLPLGVDAVGAVVRGGVALQALGLQPFGDERDDMTIAELAAAGSATPEAPAAPVPGGAVGALGARVEEGGDEDAQPDHAALLAADMTKHGIRSCEHGSLNRCRLCGVERVRQVVPGRKGAEPTWGLAWRAIGAPSAIATTGAP